MAKAASNLDWRINVPDGTSPRTELSSGWSLSGYLQQALASLVKFVETAWRLGASNPRKVIHCLKVGVALSLVSLFYYTRPLYDSVGGNAMWAVMTVVVVFEYTVGATLCKCINRAAATFLGGLLGLGVHWAAHRSGSAAEPVILGASVFLLASAATFSRFIPSIKARFDYGAMIFILTFNLVSVSGYRVDKLIDMAHQRVSTIAIGVSLCIAISIFVFPVWAGDELHQLIHRNMDKLSDSLEGCVTRYFMEEEGKGDDSLNTASYKCMLNSKAAEETMANFARWEPAHGHIGFRHPWKEYTSIGALMRSCAYCIETLNACVNSEIQSPQYLKSHGSDACMALCLHSSEVLKEMATCLKSMTRSTKLSYLVEKMKFATQELQEKLNALPGQLLENRPSLREVVPLVTMMSLLVEVAKRIEVLADRVVGLAELAKFKSPPEDKKTAKILPMDDANSTEETNKDITKS